MRGGPGGASPGRGGGPAEPDVLVVGGGPTGLAAAAAAAGAGASVLIAERDSRLGGILNQCVHDGFGLELFGESLTGPEYAARLEREALEAGVGVAVDTTVVELAGVGTGPCRLSGPAGYKAVTPCAVVLAMGCRERSFGSLAIPSRRPAGIISAGAAQRLINLDGVMVGRRAVVLGSGDIGLIMARRMILEGATVPCVVERLAYPGGLPRNLVQCLNDFGVPLLLRHTIIEVLGRDRVTGVVIAPVAESGAPVSGSARTVECDTVLVSVGLVPENELTRGAAADLDPATGGPVVDQRLMTSLPGVFSAGNVLHVHDIADRASLEGAEAGRQAAESAVRDREGAAGAAGSDAVRVRGGRPLEVRPGTGIRHVVPQRLIPGHPATLSFRVEEPRTRVRVSAVLGDAVLASVDLPYAAPSEMAKLDLGPAPAAGETGAALEVRVD